MRLSQAEPFVPASVRALRDYNRSKFVADCIAGLTVGLVALPLAMAFAISSGVPPQAGIYSAIIAGFVSSALGGSMTQISGPTGAFVVVVASIVQKHGIDGLYMCTLIAGILLVLLGITGLGTAVKYIPRPVVIGFTNGIAILIASTQIKDFFGLSIANPPSDFVGRLSSIISNWGSLSIQTTLLASASLAAIVVLSMTKKVPGSIVALLFGTVAAWYLKLPVETIETRFGGIPAGLPKIHWPVFRSDLILTLLSPALTITMLGAIESLLSAVVSDRMTGDRHNPNVELFGQGVANIICPIFGGLPATGAIARTATNIRSGGKTPVAGVIHAATLLLILLFATNLAKHIPLAVLSAILLVVSYNMGEWRQVGDILKMSKADIAVWLITFALTVFADLTVAVEAGMILAALLYIRKVTATTSVSKITPEYIADGFNHSLQVNELPENVIAYRIHGPFLFGSMDKLNVIDTSDTALPNVVILRLRNMNAIDATGLHALEVLADKLRASGRHLVMCGMREQPAQLMAQSGFQDRIGRENLQPTLADAIRRATELLPKS